MQAALSDEERIDWLRLARTDGIGPTTFHRLLRTYGSAKVALAAAPEIAKRAGRASIQVHSMADAEVELKALKKRGARLLASCEPDFPKLLAQIDPPPPLIAVQGDLALFMKPAIAIVGSRNASAAGLRMARELAEELSAKNYLIVSGLARGIDGAAHKAALEGGTAAVLAGGLDHIYPQEHAGLYDAIAERGLLISENAFGANANARDFPRRNRLVSGLSLGVVVVEAALQSGSLITARTALEQNREVMAVPASPLDPRSRGGNDLIKQGATLIENADDVIRAISAPEFDMPLMRSRTPLARTQRTAPADALTDATGLAEQIRAMLSAAPVAIDELVRQTGASAAEVSAAVLELEMAGFAVSVPGGGVAAG
jgi:DNA processing protein